MDCVDSHLKPFYVLDTMTIVGEVSSLNLYRNRHCNIGFYKHKLEIFVLS